MDRDLQAFFEVARTQLREPLDRDFEADLVRLVAAEARVSAAAAPTRELPARSRFALPIRIAFVAGSLLAASAALAVAGVHLPGPIGNAFERAGINLPNQASDHHASQPAEPAPVSSSTGQESNGSGNGKAKGHAKHGNPPHGKAKGHAKHGAPPHGKATGQNGGAPGQSESAPGQTTPQSSPPQANGEANGHAPKSAPSTRGNGHNK